METQKQDNMRETDYPNRRRPWTAVFLSLISPGLGQVYCGSVIIGFVLIALDTILTSLWMFGVMQERTPVLSFSLIICGVLTLIMILASIDAYRRARRTRYDYALKDYNHWMLYLLLLLISGAGFVSYPFYIKNNIVGNFRIPKNTMAPTIMAGDRVFSDNMAYNRNNPEYGDVVLFKNPRNRKINYIKRVVALAGDTVELKDGQLIINGQTLKREWVEKKTMQMKQQQVEGDVFWESNGNTRYQIFLSEQGTDLGEQKKDFGPITVPQYHCFVMGDNRHSDDSRMFGTLSYGALKGRFTQIYWPLDHMVSL